MFGLGRVSAFSTATMALIALGTETLAVNTSLGKFVLAVAIILQLYVNVHFITMCVLVNRDFQPEPFWFPPTVGIALGGKGGVAAAWPLVAEICLGISLFFLVMLMVPISFRIARSCSVAANPSVYILLAPTPLVLAMWNVVAGHTASFFRSPWIGLALFVAAVVFAVQTLVALFLRRLKLKAAGFTPGWAAFTFPSAAAVNGLMAARVLYFPDSFPILLFVWILVAAYVLVIFFIGGMFLWHLPSWLRVEADPSVDPRSEVRLTEQTVSA
jgi:tellurite resistance protein TehA-like permease